MKKQIISFFAFAIITSTFFFSCDRSKQKHYANITFDSIQINETIYLAEGPKSPYSNLVINFTYPVSSKVSQSLADNVNLTLSNFCLGENYEGTDIKKAVDSLKNTYAGDYKQDLLPLYQEDLKSRNDEIGWYFYYQTIKVKPIVGNPSYLIYQADHNEYSGGAHGIYSTLFFNFRLPNGELIELEDIFKPDYQKPLTELLLSQLMIQTESKDMEELQEKAYLLMNDMFPSDNFRMDKDGITFYYNVYEIAPYSSGTTELKLEYDDLKELMK